MLWLGEERKAAYVMMIDATILAPACIGAAFLILNLRKGRISAGLSRVITALSGVVSQPRFPRKNVTVLDREETEFQKLSRLSITSLSSEVSELPISPTQGTVPEWLCGSLVRVGPALFEFGNEVVNHWFDGQAMLHAFAIVNGQVTYSNKFLDTQNLRAHRAAGRVAVTEFGTDPCVSLFSRLGNLFQRPSEYQNTNVNVAKLADRYVALTETPLPMQFDLKSLATVGPMRYGDKLQGHYGTAHPHYINDGTINIVTRFGSGRRGCPEYLIYQISGTGPATGRVHRTLIARVPVLRAAYMHSFAVTENYVVLVEFPWFFSVKRMVWGAIKKFLTGSGHTVLDNFYWDADAGSCFIVVNRNDGTVEGRYKSDPFFAYHHINAFELAGGTICVDLMCYKTVMYEDLSVQRVSTGRQTLYDKSQAPQVRRYSVTLAANSEQRKSGGAVKCDVLFDDACELPRINYTLNTNPDYRYIYGIGHPSDGSSGVYSCIVKIDSQVKSALRWEQPNCLPGEPVFVPRPGSTAADDGVILSVVLDGRTRTSFLAVINAADMKEIAIVPVPHHIPAHFHGDFFPQSSSE